MFQTGSQDQGPLLQLRDLAWKPGIPAPTPHALDEVGIRL